MDCPTCGKPLQNISFENQRIDICPFCEGIWFDRGELAEVVEGMLSEGKIKSPDIKEIYRPESEGKEIIIQESRRCPRCKERLKTFNYCYDSKVILDSCPKCKGLWLDRDELRLVAEYVKGNPKMDKYAAAMINAQQKIITMKSQTKAADALMGPASIGSVYGIWFTLFPLPLRDELETQRKPWATITLIAINAVVFILQLIFVRGVGSDLVYFNSVGQIPAYAWQSDRIYTFISSMFVHAGFLHIIGNMYFLWLFGDNIEDKLGQVKFIFFYLLCGIAGSLLFCLLNPHSTVPAVGASGAISGVFGAYYLFYPRQAIEVVWLGRKRHILAATYLILWIALQVWSAALAGTEKVGIGYWAHIGGFFCGWSLAYLYTKFEQE